MAKNLAKGKLPVERGIWKNAEEATNGNHTNYSLQGGYAGAKIPAFYTLDLGDIVEVSQVRILLFDGLGHGAVADSRKYTFDVNVSVDGKQFQKVFGGYPEHQGNGWFVIDLIPKAKIRFVQLHGTGNTKNSGFHIVEFAVYDVPPPGLPGNPNQKRFSVDGAVTEPQSAVPAKSKIFISHSRENKVIGEALVELLEHLGVASGNIVFTSDDDYGIPIGMNIFEWLKERIVERPHVIFLLSPEYYKSIACLNEMGAAWVVGNDYTMIFTPDFDLDCKEFSNGALDPRRIGFCVNNEIRLLQFAEHMISITKSEHSAAILNKRIRSFLKSVQQGIPSSISVGVKAVTQQLSEIQVEDASGKVTQTFDGLNLVQKDTASSAVGKFLAHLSSDKANDFEILLLHYVIDRARVKLGTGWRKDQEIDDIKVWEKVHLLNNELSTNYKTAVGMFEMRKVAEVSDVTVHGNPREVKLIEELVELILDLPKEIEEKIAATVSRNSLNPSVEEHLPF